MPPAAHVIAGFDDALTVPPCTEAKSTLIVSSLSAIRQHGHFETYRRRLSPEALHTLLQTPAGIWVPLALAEMHYAACDELFLAQDAILGIGKSVHSTAQQSVLALSLRVAREGGVTPWLVLKTIPKLWARLFVGGATSIVELGPKEARIDIAGNSLARFAYWRTGVQGIVAGIIEPFAARAYVRETRYEGLARNHTVKYRVSWA